MAFSIFVMPHISLNYLKEDHYKQNPVKFGWNWHSVLGDNSSVLKVNDARQRLNFNKVLRLSKNVRSCSDKFINLSSIHELQLIIAILSFFSTNLDFLGYMNKESQYWLWKILKVWYSFWWRNVEDPSWK